MAMDSTMAIFDARITVLDFETTGSVPGFPNEPWQIGLVSLQKGKVDSSSMFERLIRVDPSRPFNAYAPGRHAQLRDEIAQAPAAQALWLKLSPRLSGLPLCAHNTATEKKVLRHMAPMHKFGLWIDTLKLARKAWPGCDSYALENLIVMLDLKAQIDVLCPGRQAHDALYDAVAAACLLEHLIAQQGWGNITIGELASF
jgi:DNA polymerase III epsilon subunit-like protein